MPDFTNLDPVAISKFWIYFVGSFFVGGFLGWSISEKLFCREKKAIEEEQKVFEEKLKEMESLTEESSRIRKEFEELKSQTSKNQLYWMSKKRNYKGNKVLYDTIQERLKK